MWLVIICSLIGGFFSLLGGIILLSHHKLQKYVDYLTAFAGGALLAAAFSDLLPEALHDAEHAHLVVWCILLGLLFFFVLETFFAKLCGKKCHHQHHHNLVSTDSKIPMIVISDTIHNFVDGIAIAAGFLISPMSGFVTTVAVATHEIPQEIGEFALLFQKKLAKKKIILVGLLSSLATTLSAVIFYYLGNAANLSLAPLLGLVAGFFIYLAVGDIIPSINQEKDFSVRFKKVIILLISTVVMSFIITSLHEVAHH